MKIRSTVILCALGLALAACSKTEQALPTPDTPPPPAVPADPETPPEGPATPPEAGDSPEAAALPGWWAPLFELGKVSTWSVKETLVGMDFDSDLDDPQYKTENREGRLTCEVVALDVSLGRHTSTVECTGHTFELTGDGGPMGRWVTDGEAVWLLDPDGEEPRLRFTANPIARTILHDDDGQVTEDEEDASVGYVVEAGKEPGTWCHHFNIMRGDGATTTHCFSEARGLVAFRTYGGGAAEDRTLEVTLVK